MSNRRPLSKKLRFEVFKRDAFTCVYCGRQPPAVILHCDHVVPVAAGGPDHTDNLVTACDDCNRGKAARLLSVAPLTVEQKADLIRDREEQLAAYNEMVFEILAREEDQAWEVAKILMHAWGDRQISQARFAAIQMFLKRLPFADVYEAAQIAMARFRSGKDRGFRYFCGVCWNRVRRDQSGEADD